MPDEIQFHSEGLDATDDQLKMLMAFCEDFQINIVIKADGTGLILNNATEIQKALLQGFFSGITGKRLKFKELSKHSFEGPS
jgi:hypothetical protein